MATTFPRTRRLPTAVLLAVAALLLGTACAKREPLPPSLIVVSYAAPREYTVELPYAAVLAATRAHLTAGGATFAVAEPEPGSAAIEVQEREYDQARFWIYQPSITIISEAVQTDAGRKPHHWHVVDLRYPDGVPCRRREGVAREPLGDTPPTLDPHSFPLPYVDGVLTARMTIRLQRAGDQATRILIDVADAKAPYAETANPDGVWRTFLARPEALKAKAWQPVLPAKTWLSRAIIAPITERAQAPAAR